MLSQGKEYAKKQSEKEAVVLVQFVAAENVSSNSESPALFSGEQTYSMVKDPELIWDSGSTITLAKEQKLLDDDAYCVLNFVQLCGCRTA